MYALLILTTCTLLTTKLDGKELMLIIIATILTLTTPTGSLSPDHALIYLACFRILLGIGVGGDYPMSASVTSDRASLRKRGTMLAYIFANQGWGSFAGSLATIAVLAAYRGAIEGKGQISKTDGVWRVVVGISLIPAFGTLYQRLTLPEATRFSEARAKAMQNEEDDITELKKKQEREDVERAMKDGEVSQEKMEYPPSPQEKPPAVIAKEKGHFRGPLCFHGKSAFTDLPLHRVYQIFLAVEACQNPHRYRRLLVPAGYCVRLFSSLLIRF